MSFNLAVVLRESARSHPAKAAIVSEDGNVSYGELDAAAMDILKLAAPFDAFPKELAARHDVLRFAYEWQFVGGRLAGSSVMAPASQ